jgi:hypothetical protein
MVPKRAVNLGMTLRYTLPPVSSVLLGMPRMNAVRIMQCNAPVMCTVDVTALVMCMKHVTRCRRDGGAG